MFWGHEHQQGSAWSQHHPRFSFSRFLVDVAPRSPITALLFWRLRLTQYLPLVSTSRETAPALTALCPDWLCEPLQFSPNPFSHFLELSGSERTPRSSPWLPVSVPNKVSVLQAKRCLGSRPAEDRSLGLGKWLENRLCGEGLDCGLIRLETLTTECQLHCTPCPVPAERTLLQIHLQPL